LPGLAQLVDPGRNLPEPFHPRRIAGKGEGTNALGNEYRRPVTVLALDREGFGPSLPVCIQCHRQILIPLIESTMLNAPGANAPARSTVFDRR
jgi:hypothetical protein